MFIEYIEKSPILLIDEDPSLLHKLQEMFNESPSVDSALNSANSSYIIDNANTCAEAIDKVTEALNKSRPYNLAFIEYQIANCSGLKLIHKLWQIDSNLQFVICTADNRLDWQQIINIVGESDQVLILQKPFSELELRQIVHAMIRKWQLGQQWQSVTKFMEVQNHKLDSAYKELREVQNQLVHSEKMSSVGQLSAGVAHEINNPIGFINSNMNILSGYIADLLLLIDEYQKLESDLTNSELLKSVQDLKQKLDLNFLKSDLLDLLDESKEGVERVKRIVQDLKDFSHPENKVDQWVWADLHAGLESTLNIVMNELKYKAKIIKEYGDIPKINCLPSQLNQVFVNILVNAAYAIESQGVITIRTGTENTHIWIEISDTGCGIGEDKIKNIFDPFYTTKPIGKGTGLGLAISYGIVKKHKGEIKVASKEGKGTSFRVILPVNPKEQV